MMPLRLAVPLIAGIFATALTGCDDPVASEPADRYDVVAAGLEHSCATALNGVTYCWGQAEKNRLGYLSDRDPCLPDGTICMRPVPMWGVSGFRDITLGDAHGCGILTSQAYCWGWNEYGQLGDAGQVLTRCYGTLPLPCSLEPIHVVLGFPVVDIDAGASTTCAVTEGGEAWCWGLNQFGQLGVGHTTHSSTPLRAALPEDEHFVAVTSARSHTCAVAESGSAYCWGANPDGELGDGTLDWSILPVRVASDAHFVMIDAAWGHTCALDVEGAAYCWGFYGEGRLGAGASEINRVTPFRLAIPEPLVQISTGGMHTCAVSADGSLYCWGHNIAGQLGRGAGPDDYLPAETEFPGRAIQVAAGFLHTCAIAHDADLFCWGANQVGQLGTGDRVATAFPLRVGPAAPRID